MEKDQQLNKAKIFCKASKRQRLWAVVIFLSIALFFTVLSLAGKNKIDIGFFINPCGFKQQFGLPCPTCGMTTAAIAFSQGKIFDAFYIQPACGLFCCVLVIAGFLYSLTAVFGVYFCILKRIVAEIKIRYIVLAIIIIAAAGWAVTLARTISER